MVFVAESRPRLPLFIAGTRKLVNLFVETNIFSYHICYENIAKYSRVKRQTDRGQTDLNKMLVKKTVLNAKNKVGTFTQGFKD